MAITKIAARNAWFQVHKWIGLILAIAIIPISITGAALVWHDGLDEWLNPVRVAEGAPVLAPGAYAAAAATHLAAGETLASLDIPEQGAVVASAARPPQPGGGRPVRTQIWLAPTDAAVLDTAGSDEGVIRVMHVLHGSLFIPEWGRAIVGWVGAAMLISSLSGIWLWWPTAGRWIKGLRWRRHRHFDTNLHHLFGFWIAIPLFILSATGVWISFPKAFERFDAPKAEGGKPDNKRGGEAKGPSREQRLRARPIANPAVPLDRALALTGAAAPGRVARISWPTDVAPQWIVAIGPDARDRQTEVKVDAATGATTAKPPSTDPETLARLMRRIHDGSDMGLMWQTIVFLGGLLPAILGITGIIMWWRARGWRDERDRRQQTGKARPAST